MSIKVANQKFKDGNYAEALELYNEIVKNRPELSNILHLNINISKRKLANDQIKNDSTNCSNLDEIRRILTETPTFSPLSDEVLNSYIALTRQIKSEKLDQTSALLALKCVRYSPFQTNLLKSAYHILEVAGIARILLDYQFKPSFTLGGMIKMAVDDDYWAAYRNIISSSIEINNSFCKHANYLINRKHDSRDELQNGTKNIGAKKTNKISFGTILLNEEKFIAQNLCQHYTLCDEWILVEGACKGYPERKVSTGGLSLDKTNLIINLFPDPESKIIYVQHGWTKALGEDAKSELRNEYISRVKGEYLIVIDADEFYLHEDLIQAVTDLETKINVNAVVLPQVHFWKNSTQFITGDYYDISHTRIFRNLPGMKYIKNHNFPELGGKFIHVLGQIKYPRTIKKNEIHSNSYIYDGPKCYHMGFAKDYDDMKDKTDYYINRGESKTRPETTRSRAAWFDDELPKSCEIRLWGGNIPKYLWI